MFFFASTLQQAKPWSIIKTVDHINVSGLFLTWNIFFTFYRFFLVSIVSFALNLKVQNRFISSDHIWYPQFTKLNKRCCCLMPCLSRWYCFFQPLAVNDKAEIILHDNGSFIHDVTVPLKSNYFLLRLLY